MADFADVVAEIKKTNSKLDKLTQATDPKGAAAAETRREEKAEKKKQTTLFEQMADSLKALHKSFLDSIKEKGKMGLGIIIAVIASPASSAVQGATTDMLGKALKIAKSSVV